MFTGNVQLYLACLLKTLKAYFYIFSNDPFGYINIVLTIEGVI